MAREMISVNCVLTCQGNYTTESSINHYMKQISKNNQLCFNQAGKY